MAFAEVAAQPFRRAGAAVTITPMGPDALEPILAFANALPPHDLLFLQRDIRNPRVVAAWIERIASGGIASFIAMQGGAVMGCTALVRDELSWSRHVAEVRLLVHPDMRGNGLGRRLAELCVEQARASGIAKLGVRMTPDQGSALAVFEKLGFRPEALLRDQVRDAAGQPHDIAIMALDLTR